MNNSVCLTPRLPHSSNQPDAAARDEIDRARQAPAILYIDHKNLTRECVGQQLAVLLLESTVVTVARVGDVPEGAREARRFSVCILNKHAGLIGDSELAAEFTQLADLAPHLPLVVLSDVDDADDIVKAFALGVRGYIPINLPIKQAVEAIRLVGVGGSYVPSSFLSTSMHRGAAQNHTERNEHHCTERFSPRQMEVLQRLWQGKQNKMIAYDLKMCESTVKVHIRHIMKKLNARNRTQIVLLTRSLNEIDGVPIEYQNVSVS